MIFVFGSNERGNHAGGAARHARINEGAIYGVGFGLQGNSFAIPTLGLDMEQLNLGEIHDYVAMFITYAKRYKASDFKVTRIGCGIAGFKDSDIAPLFYDAPANCHFDYAWMPYLGDMRNYWGTL